MKYFKYILLLILLSVQTAFAANYYVAMTGNDTTGNGSIGTPWLTIDKCANTATAGDFCIVRAGTYNESVTPANSGTNSTTELITYMAYPGETVTVRQFALSNNDYIRITGFTFTHTDTTYNRAISLLDSDYCQILNNIFDHLYGQAIYSKDTNPSNYTITRGNTVRYTGCPTGDGLCNGNPGPGSTLYGDYNLTEYNSMEQCPDFINVLGTYGIVRNNFMDTFDESNFPDATPNAVHADIFQPYSTSRVFFEANWAKDNVELNSHFTHIETAQTYDVWRGNVGIRFGSYILGSFAADNLMWYNNTFVDFSQATNANSALNFDDNAGDNSENNFAFNNLFYSVSNPATGTIFAITAGSSATLSNNLCYDSGTHASCVSTADPVFVNYATDDLHIQTTSPAKAVGKAITLVNDGDGGTGLTFRVDDSGYFTSGFGITTGDKIKVGTNPVTTITGIDYVNHDITVADSITWADNDEVILGQVGNASKDIGAFPYYASGYALSGMWYLSAGTVYITPSDASLVRFVEVWEDGLPIGTDSTSPYSVAGIGAGTVTVKIYSLYASETPIVTATEDPIPTITHFTVDPSGAFVTIHGSENLAVTTGAGYTLSSDGDDVTLTHTSISGTDIIQATSRTILSTETLTYSYTGTDTKDLAGNELAAITDEVVTNSSTQSGAVVSETAFGATGQTAFGGSGSTVWN